nr:chorismate-binding protein [Fundidesulfovibrio terrae]
MAPHAPDALVTPPMPGVPASGLVGLWPVAEWRMGRDGGKEELKRFCFATAGSALGFLSYHAGFGAMGLDLPAPDFPAGVFRKYAVLLAPSPDARLVHVFSDDKARAREAAALVRQGPGQGAVRNDGGGPALPAFPGGLRASLDRPGYEQAVTRALTHILDGDVYQLNLSIRFEADLPDGLAATSLFTGLMRAHPAMFYGLYHDSPYAVVSTSPERFIRVRQGKVLSQPIKGTRRVGQDRTAALRELLASPKEDAELSMIVDLIRNDVGANCAYGSVGVSNHRSVFEVDGLLQMYSNVTGRLRGGSTCLDLLWDALPPGSVTGCPKRRAVEIIADLEPHHREASYGCLAVVQGPRDLDSSVAIRTAALDSRRGVLGFHAGSGIVVDSDPAMEYEETLAKAAKFLALTGRADA